MTISIIRVISECVYIELSYSSYIGMCISKFSLSCHICGDTNEPVLSSESRSQVEIMDATIFFVGISELSGQILSTDKTSGIH